jgi:DNA-binding NtrC family response regulator
VKPTLLILDDDPIITCVITLVANEIGFAARTTASVAKCLDALDEPDAQPPAAMIVDIFMPEGDAFDLLKGMSARESHVPLIVMTGVEPWYLGVIREFAQVWDIKVLDTLTKPLDHERLADNLRRLYASLPAPGDTDAGYGAAPRRTSRAKRR